MKKQKEPKAEKEKIRNKKPQLEKKSEKIKPENKKAKKQKESIQAFFVLLMILIVFLAFLIPYFYIKNQTVFEFAGVTWQVEKEVDVTFYHTQFNKSFEGIYYGKHNTFFRTDPRTNNIPVNISNLIFHRNIIISMSPEVSMCDKEILVTDSLAQIAIALPYYNKNVGVTFTDNETASEINKEPATCENHPDQTTLIQVEMGDVSRVIEERENKCYRLIFADCSDNFRVSEKFILEIIKQLNKPLS